MTLFSDPLTYLFYPNPGNAHITSPKAFILLLLCAALVFASFGIRRWRSGVTNAVTRKLSRSWSMAAFWFGITGLFLVLARVEEVSYVSMRFWWAIWFAALCLYLTLQVRIFRARHYEVLPAERSEDPRAKYLPARKKH